MAYDPELNAFRSIITVAVTEYIRSVREIERYDPAVSDFLTRIESLKSEGEHIAALKLDRELYNQVCLKVCRDPNLLWG